MSVERDTKSKELGETQGMNKQALVQLKQSHYLPELLFCQFKFGQWPLVYPAKLKQSSSRPTFLHCNWKNNWKYHTIDRSMLWTKQFT